MALASCLMVTSFAPSPMLMPPMRRVFSSSHTIGGAVAKHSPIRLQAPPPPLEDDGQAKLTKLLVSILIDLVGIATYALPAVGEVGDLAWAPVSAYLVYSLYGNRLLAGLAFAEELLPGLDIIPTATIAWILENTDFGQNLNAQAPSSSGPTPPSWQPPRSSEADDRDAGMKRAEPERRE